MSFFTVVYTVTVSQNSYADVDLTSRDDFRAAVALFERVHVVRAVARVSGRSAGGFVAASFLPSGSDAATIAAVTSTAYTGFSYLDASAPLNFDVLLPASHGLAGPVKGVPTGNPPPIFRLLLSSVPQGAVGSAFAHVIFYCRASGRSPNNLGSDEPAVPSHDDA